VTDKQTNRQTYRETEVVELVVHHSVFYISVKIALKGTVMAKGVWLRQINFFARNRVLLLRGQS
jgi:hypothetical protein